MPRLTMGGLRTSSGTAASVVTTLAERVHAAVGDFPADPAPDLPLGRGGPLAHGTAVLMRRVVEAMYPTIAPEALRLCATWGEVVDLVDGHDEQDHRLPEARRGSGEGHTVRLRPLRHEDVALLYEAALDPAEGYRWRMRGRGTSFEGFAHLLHEGVLAQYIVETRDGSLPVGLVMAYNYRPEAGHCAVGMQRALPGVGRGGEVVGGLLLFLGYLFRSFPLRKVFFDVPEYNAHLVPEDSSVMVPDGRNREYYYHAGRYWDRLFYSVAADDYRAAEDKFYGTSDDA